MCDEIQNDDQGPGNGEENLQAEPRKVSAMAPRSGFRNFVRRIQLANEFSRLSKANNEADDCFPEEVKLKTYGNTALRRLSKVPRPRKSSVGPSIVSEISEHLHGEPSNKKLFIKGEIKFLNEESKEYKPYIAIEPRTLQTNIDYVFKELWELDVPKIITFMITSKSHKCQWQNKKQINHFQAGIAKAAMSTNMWILTNGLNCGATAYICSAIENELKKTRLKRVCNIENIPLLLGISFANDLVYGNRLCNINNSESLVCLENQGFSNGDKFELNSFHSHFIIARNSGDINQQGKFTLKLIQMLVKGEECQQISNQDAKLPVDVPLVSILIEGEPENITLVLNLIKMQIPVVVMKGSGGLADIVASAYFRIWDTFRDTSAWDPDYIEDYVKPLLGSKIGSHFITLKNNDLIRGFVRDQVIECIRLSKQEGREYLTILDMHKPNTCNLRNLSEHLLNALLRSRRDRHRSTHEQILRDFDLIMDWNCAEVANNLFEQHSMNITELFKFKFFDVLTRPNREQFVDILLSYGFQLHRFLTPSQLNRLFRIIHEDEFFRTVCWESALGQSSTARQGKFFIENDLNYLIEFCSGLGQFVNTDDLHLNSLGVYTTDQLSAERKALVLLVIWAVMQNQYELVKVIWKYSDHPVHLALIISLFFERLSYNVVDSNTKAEMKQKTKQFADYGIGVLDRCYNENISQAYNILRESIKDWNYMTVVDIAANAHLKQFLAHPCCQKWLTNTFQGKIRLREITWGFFTVPTAIKILLCSFLVFPMYIWVRFKDDDLTESNYNKSELEEDFDVYENMYSNNQGINHNLSTNPISNTAIPFENQASNTFATGYTNTAFEDTEITRARHVSHIHRRDVLVKKQPPLVKMVQMMWSSPITKFYTSQVFYVAFLVLLSVATLYPNCGSTFLDSAVCLWTILIVISSARHTYILVINYPSISIYPKILEIFLMGAFVLVYVITRIFRYYFYPIYGQKVIISLALLYFYYRLITIYLPISPTLGPLLHRFHLMISVDFVNYLRITLVILLSNAIVISALQFPYREVSFNSVSSIIHQGLVSLLSSNPPTDIKVKTDMDKQQEYCPQAGLSDYNATNGNATESSHIVESDSWVLYFFVFQYMIILKLIVGPLLFSIFAATASKWVTEIESIWKFQRYHLVIDFANRLSFPEPISLFYYLYVAGHYLQELVTRLCKMQNSPWQRKQTAIRAQHIISPEDCLYWKQLAAEYLDSERKKHEEAQIAVKEWEYIQEISEEITFEKKVLREIKAKIVELEKSLQWKVMAEDYHPTSSGHKEAARLSRLSPYPDTGINRYPLATKYTSWDVAFFAYEPVCYTKPRSEFDLENNLLIDEDILKLKLHSLQDKHFAVKMPSYKWNDIELDRNGLLIDRRSWHIRQADHIERGQARAPIKYRLENNFLPLNPLGRTGICGKGAHRRWGPNHHFVLIITHTVTHSDGSKQTKLLLEMSPLNKWQLIERYVNNENEIYDHFVRLFQLDSPVRSEFELKQKLETELSGALVDLVLVQGGYLDDPLNTDNAWKEANLYLMKLRHSLPKLLADECRCTWCPLSKQTIAGLSLVHANVVQIVSELL